jgi:hypothetical protein
MFEFAEAQETEITSALLEKVSPRSKRKKSILFISIFQAPRLNRWGYIFSWDAVTLGM